MWKLRRPGWRHAALFAVLVVVAFGLDYVLTVNGEAYEFARQFVAEDRRVLQVTGVQRRQKLAFWRTTSHVSGDTQGDASLSLQVDGASGKFEIPLALQKRDGRWQVLSATAIDESGKAVVLVP